MRRTVPFALAAQTLTMLWYATADHHPDDIAAHRERAPWYSTKSQPSTADMLAKLPASSSPQDFSHLTPTGPHLQKSTPSAWPGTPMPHNRESRATTHPNP